MTRVIRQGQQGFTLIELMIVVAIVGILVAVAVPVYQRYTIRTQVTEGIQLSTSAKNAVSQYYMTNGDWPPDNLTAGLADPTEIAGHYTAQVDVTDNVIEIQYGGDAHTAISGEMLVLTAVVHSGSVSWNCASAGVIEDKHLPAACR